MRVERNEKKFSDMLPGPGRSTIGALMLLPLLFSGADDDPAIALYDVRDVTA